MPLTESKDTKPIIAHLEADSNDASRRDPSLRRLSPPARRASATLARAPDEEWHGRRIARSPRSQDAGNERMDPISHVAITAVLLGRKPGTLLASVAPDLPWYLFYTVWLLSQRGLVKRGASSLSSGELPMPPRWLREIHYATHSAVVLGMMVGLFVCLPRRRRTERTSWPRRAGAWLLHILVDMPTHSRQRMGPRIFWPLSRWAYDGVSWADSPRVRGLVSRLVAALLKQ